MEYIERTAKLIEAGEYPDKGVTITEEDLESIIENYKQHAPIRIEHTETPLDGATGYLVEIWRQGKELWGKLQLSKPLYELLEATGKKGLSLGLDWAKRIIREVSLTTSPRVPDAAVFSCCVYWDTNTSHQEVDNNMGDKGSQNNAVSEEVSKVDMAQTTENQQIVEMSAMIESLKSELEQLKQEKAAIEFALRQSKHQKSVDDLVASGKLIPAVKDELVDLLSRIDTVEFSSNGNCADALLGLLNKLPAVVLTSSETQLKHNKLSSINKQLGIDDIPAEKITEIRQKYGI